MKVLLATQVPFAPEAVQGVREIIQNAGHEFRALEKYPSVNDLAGEMADVDALIVRSDKVTAEVVKAAPNLKIVVRAGAGYDNLDLGACTAAKVVAMNTPGQNANAVAELALAMMIFMERSQFTPATGCELSGKTLGIQAFGNIGRLVAAKAEALGMKVKAVDPFLEASEIEAAGVESFPDVKSLYSSCDIVSIHIPCTEQTRSSIGYDLLTSMRYGALLINTARKEVIDEEGLRRALADRPDLKYATDVAPDNMDRLREEFGLRVFATPKKMGAHTSEANVNAAFAAARQIVDFFATGNTRFQLNK